MNELTTESPYELHKDMKFIDEIDHGAFGKVIRVQETKKNLDLAVKVINKSGAGSVAIQQMKEEVSILKKLNHNNIVKFYGYIETNNQLLIETEYIKYGTLSRWMKDHHKISEKDASTIIGKVLSAVEYLHSMHICHRDIKPENIMISRENDLTSIKIIDFGLSAQHFNYLSNNEYCGTFIYMAPEQIEKKLYYYSVDIWSIGILMYMLLNNGKHPFYHKDDKKSDFIQKIKLAKLHFINKLSYMAKHLMHKLCEPNPSWRYSANLAVKHPWITRNPNDDIPLTFNEILSRNNTRKNAHTLFMVSIFLNYIKNNNKILNISNNNITNNHLDPVIKKIKSKSKIFIIDNDYINKCNIISIKQKEVEKKIRERHLDVQSTDEEDSFEKKKNKLQNSIITNKRRNKSPDTYELYAVPQKKYSDDLDFDYSNKRLTNKKLINKKKLINLYSNNNLFLLRNFQNSNTNIRGDKKTTNKGHHLLSLPSNNEKYKEKERSKERNQIEFYNKKINSQKNIIFGKYLNKNENNIINTNSIKQDKIKSRSITKLYVNEENRTDEVNSNHRENMDDDINYKEIILRKSPNSFHKSNKLNKVKLKIKPELSHMPTLSSQVKNYTSKKENNNYIGNYDIKPLYLPFIGIKPDEKRNKMI